MRDLLAFIDASPCAWFAADTLVEELTEAGFRPLDLTVPAWDLSPGRWYVRREAAVIGFVLRDKVRPQRFHLVGAHTDSPHLRLKPRPAFTAEGCLQLGVEVYGGALHNSWLDRDLGLAGTVHLAGGALRTVRLDQPIARVPQLAIHLDRRINEDGLKLNPQQHLAPIWGLANGRDPDLEFRSMLATAAGVDPGEILGHDLSLYDLTPARRGGVRNELVFAGRLDNLASCHAGVMALIAAAEGQPEVMPVLACFDHEEVGSESRSGANGELLGGILERILLELGGDRRAFLAALAGSFLLSADMAHAAHPSYPERHEPRHKPRLGAGPVLKSNSNQRYATSAASAARVRELARKVDVPLQDFVARTDLGCGSTIGPACGANLGVAVADLGTPMLSMHSARECAAVADHGAYVRLLAAHLHG